MEKIRYLTEKEVCKMTKLALPTLRNYRVLGIGPDYIKAGEAVRYRLDDVINYMEAGRVFHKD